MRRELMLLGLALSLLFNVFFVAGYLRARASAGAAVATAVAEELDLDGAQSALFSELRARDRADAEVYRDSLALVRQAMLDALDGADGDPERLQELIDREIELRRQRRLGEMDRYRDFVASLGPEQRQRLRSKMHRSMHRRGRHGEMIRRFDADGDGRLDDDERAAARERLRARRAERGGRRDGREQRVRRELRKRFDADGDGRLDAAERRALAEWLEK